MPSTPSTPSWVFSYLPNPTPAPKPTTTTTNTSPPSTASTPSFLTSLYKAAISTISTPRLDPDQERLATLQGVKASLEQQIAFRQKAGLSTRDLEREQMGKIDQALRSLEGEKKGE
ncbi:hypothetical protein N7G274_006653 [Stereocaulon virgatum]|uniref:Mediator of RNA polymerase II transcription subunit 9 n=1 Tax=Stereocaulon virgatum TaxID=373712 RepID=A0ABR4A5B7_9LECA